MQKKGKFSTTKKQIFWVAIIYTPEIRSRHLRKKEAQRSKLQTLSTLNHQKGVDSKTAATVSATTTSSVAATATSASVTTAQASIEPAVVKREPANDRLQEIQNTTSAPPS